MFSSAPKILASLSQLIKVKTSGEGEEELIKKQRITEGIQSFELKIEGG